MPRIGIELRTKERDTLRRALKDIDAELQWFRAANGCVSRDDLVGMVRQSLKSLDEVRELVYSDKN